MKKIVPFRKEIDFGNNISEITSIALEHSYNIKEKEVSGEFLINGDYKMVDTSTNTEDFDYNIPFNIELDDKYQLDKVTLDIDDFYYEIVNDRLLVLNIDVLLDHLEEKPLPIINLEEVDITEEKDENENEEIIEERCVEKENIVTEEKIVEKSITIEENDIIEKPIIIDESIEKVALERKNNVNIFDNFDNNECYSTYSICIINEGDTIESLLEKYNVTKEELDEYNNLSDFKTGMKLIIPSK